MRYQQNIRQNTTTSKNRRRNVICFYTPYSANVVTKFWKYFLFLIKKHFPPHSNFHKIFLRNTVMISYSCLPNMETVINSHNYKITNPKTVTKERTCNSADKAKYPLNQNYFINNIITNQYCCQPTRAATEKSTSAQLKLHSNHQKSFKFLK